jgi:hypothetical protein
MRVSLSASVFVFTAAVLLLLGCASDGSREESSEPVAAVAPAYVAPEDRDLVEREIARRQALLIEADRLLQQGDALMESGGVEEAQQLYRRAVELAP